MQSDLSTKGLLGLAAIYLAIILIVLGIVLASGCTPSTPEPTATAEPTLEDPTPTQEKGLETLFIVRIINPDNNVNIRTGPGVTYSKTGYLLYPREDFAVFDNSELLWYGGCVLARDGSEECTVNGWIYQPLVEIVEES